MRCAPTAPSQVAKSSTVLWSIMIRSFGKKLVEKEHEKDPDRIAF
jgi:hypothetical protein